VKEKKKKKKTLGDLQGDGDFCVKPSEDPVKQLDCSEWPLLLKVGTFNKLAVQIVKLIFVSEF